jgi:hypothetical protein
MADSCRRRNCGSRGASLTDDARRKEQHAACHVSSMQGQLRDLEWACRGDDAASGLRFSLTGARSLRLVESSTEVCSRCEVLNVTASGYCSSRLWQVSTTTWSYFETAEVAHILRTPGSTEGRRASVTQGKSERDLEASWTTSSSVLAILTSAGAYLHNVKYFGQCGQQRVSEEDVVAHLINFNTTEVVQILGFCAPSRTDSSVRTFYGEVINSDACFPPTLPGLPKCTAWLQASIVVLFGIHDRNADSA